MSKPSLPALVWYGLRFAGAVTLAFWLAFEFELQDPYWAGTSAALVCQPVLGASLRKGLFRALGTLIGVVAILAMAGCFPQDRTGFVLALAGWCAICCFYGTVLPGFLGYGAILAGYTAVIVAGPALEHPDQAFSIATARAAEVLIGIFCSTTVMALTDLGSSRYRLARSLRQMGRDGAMAILVSRLPGVGCGEHPALVAEGIRRLARIDGLLDQAIGEGGHRRFSVGPVRAALDGLFACVAAPGGIPDRTVGAERDCFNALGTALARGEDPPPATIGMLTEAVEILQVVDGSLGSGLDRHLAATGLSGAGVALEASTWLLHRGAAAPRAVPSYAPPGDPVPPLINAARAFFAIIGCSVFWMATRWSSGPSAIEFAAISVLILSIKPNASVGDGTAYAAGTLLGIGIAATTKFALLPGMQTFAGLALVVFVMMVPLAAFSAVPKLNSVFGPAVMNLIPIWMPLNEQTYDTASFYNTATGIFIGCLAGTFSLRLLVSLSPAVVSGRILRSARMDCRALQDRTWFIPEAAWVGRMRQRATSMPSGPDGPLIELSEIYAAGMGALYRPSMEIQPSPGGPTGNNRK